MILHVYIEEDEKS